jgi:hypothetical protein
MRKLALLAYEVAVLTISLNSESPAANDLQIVDVLPDQASDVYFFVNLRGRLYLKIAAAGGNRPCAEFWWITWGFGNIKDVGERCGSFTLDIPEPSLTDPVISGKLRTSGAPYRLKIAVSAYENVAHSATLDFP